MAGLDAFGTILERSDGAATPVFAPIGNATSVGGPEIERETLDVTAHDSPDGWREFVGSLKDAGEVSLEVNYDPREHDALVEDFDDIAPRTYRLTFPNGIGAWEFPAILTGFSPEAPHDDKLAAELTFKVTGKPVITGEVVTP